MKKKILIVAGTRPEVIKMAPVVFELKESAEITPVFLTTAQHRQMLDQTLEAFSLKSDYDLNLMRPRQNLSNLTANLITEVTHFLETNQPDAVLVQGDTTTVLSTALASFYQKIPIGHIEAGLRTYNIHSPFPEEMNRRMVDPISQWCFTPTKESAQNLAQEKIPGKQIHITGNTVVDALLWISSKLDSDEMKSRLMTRIEKAFTERFFDTDESKDRRNLILVTGHRRESFGEGFEKICSAIKTLARDYPEIGIIYPVHLNPQVQEPVNRLLGGLKNVALIPPVAYQEFIYLMKISDFILSDSGGVQEEAPSLGKPVLVLRETTERPEGVEAGTCKLVGTDPNKIVSEASLLLGDEIEYKRRSNLANPYGDGNAARRIRKILETSATNGEY